MIRRKMIIIVESHSDVGPYTATVHDADTLALLSSCTSYGSLKDEGERDAVERAINGVYRDS